jgi:signal transduction histidine kinase
MSVKTGRGGVSIALGDLLMTEDPVWVWDIRARKILWANRAGQAFWSADGLDALRARRFPARDKSLARIAMLAGETGPSREWTEKLTFPGRAEKGSVTCYMQSLQVAGGQPGVIVRALENPRESAPKSKRPPPRKQTAATASDTAALNAIAAQLSQARTGQERKGARQPAPPAEVAPTPQMTLIREFCHELRNPLTVIIGFAERIRDSDSAKARSKAKAYAENILEGAELAMAILRDFAGRLREDGAPPQPPETADVKASVKSCLRLVAPLAKQAGLTLDKSLGRRLPDLRTEERVLKQILLNVLINAVRHQKTGGRIAVTAKRRRDGSLLIAISDDGVGMTKKEIKKGLSGKRRPPSASGDLSGLGLPLVKRLVESAGGSIAIESARRKGTTVEMAFPPPSLVWPD